MNIFIILITVFIWVESLPANQLNLQLATESGRNYSEFGQRKFVSRLIGRAQYQHNFDKTFVRFKTRFAPEFFDYDFQTNTLKFSGNVFVSRNLKNFTWQSRFFSKNYYYRSPAYNNISFHIFSLGSTVRYPVNQFVEVNWGLDLHLRDTSTDPHNRLNSIVGEIGTLLNINQESNAQLDLSVERFHIEERFAPTFSPLNSGWRYGPTIRLHHKSDYLYTLQYQYIIHSTELSSEFSDEHNFQMVWGLIFNKKWSFFLYLNYQFRDETKNEVPLNIAYSPINNENWYYLQLGYDILKHLEIYIKAGYMKDDLLYRELAIEESQFLLGFNISN
ncbi:MAG: hypothetical protein GF313_13005 [Caldithrix sp.]|nr:hypothetical protein [Caldithrix sp.]